MSRDTVDLDIAYKHPSWANAIESGAIADIEGLCARALAALFQDTSDFRVGELSLALVDDDAIQTLNRQYRKKDRPTNVLSFPMTQNIPEMPMLGDIVMAFETLQREAKEKSVDLSAHFSHLFIHGFLHLQGYDHETPEDAKLMETLEVSVLKALQIKNPYRFHPV